MLFSGQDPLPSLIENAAGWTVGALVLLIVCKGLAYGISLSSFRGGPVFPGLFIGAAGGIALSHLAGLPMIAGAAMGMGAMTTAMLGLPLTSVLITTLFLGADGITLMPVVIVAVAVSYVASARLAPTPAPRSRPRRSLDRTGRLGIVVDGFSQPTNNRRMAHDPVVAETVRAAEHLEPRFVLVDRGATRHGGGTATAARPGNGRTCS